MLYRVNFFPELINLSRYALGLPFSTEGAQECYNHLLDNWGRYSGDRAIIDPEVIIGNVVAAGYSHAAAQIAVRSQLSVQTIDEFVVDGFAQYQTDLLLKKAALDVGIASLSVVAYYGTSYAVDYIQTTSRYKFVQDKFLSNFLTNTQLAAFNAGATFYEAAAHAWTVNQLVAFKSGAPVEQATGHDWTRNEIAALKVGASAEQAISYNWTSAQIQALKFGVPVEQATSHDWTWQQIRALIVGVPIVQAMNHNWTWEQIQVLKVGVPVEQVINHNWTYAQVSAVRVGSTVEQAIGHDWRWKQLAAFNECVKKEGKSANECVQMIYPESVEDTEVAGSVDDHVVE